MTGRASAEPLRTFPFIVSCGRAGTTLLRAMLNSHPAMAVPPETRFIPILAATRPPYAGEDGLDADRLLDDLFTFERFPQWDVPRDLMADALRRSEASTYPEAIRVLFATYAAHRGRERYADKTPGYIRSVPALAAMFPESRFIFVTRDPRNVTLSYRQQGRSVAQGAYQWTRSVELARRAKASLGPGRLHEVRYEDLVDAPQATLEGICEAIDLPYDPAMLRYDDAAGGILAEFGSMSAPDRSRFLSSAHANIARPLAPKRDYAVEMSDEDLATVEAMTGRWMDRYGYERRAGRPSIRARRDAASFRAAAAAKRVGRRISWGLRRSVRRAVRGSTGPSARVRRA